MVHLIKIEDIENHYLNGGTTDSDNRYYFDFDDLFTSIDPYVEMSNQGFFDFGVKHNLVDDELAKSFTNDEVERIKKSSSPYQTASELRDGSYLFESIEDAILTTYMSDELDEELLEQVKKEIEEELGRDYLVTSDKLGSKSIELEYLDEDKLEELVDDNKTYDSFLTAFLEKVNNE